MTTFICIIGTNNKSAIGLYNIIITNDPNKTLNNLSDNKCIKLLIQIHNISVWRNVMEMCNRIFEVRMDLGIGWFEGDINLMNETVIRINSDYNRRINNTVSPELPKASLNYII